MESFTFDELDERGKDAAFVNYRTDSNFLSVERLHPRMSIKKLFHVLDCRVQ